VKSVNFSRLRWASVGGSGSFGSLEAAPHFAGRPFTGCPKGLVLGRAPCSFIDQHEGWWRRERAEHMGGHRPRLGWRMVDARSIALADGFGKCAAEA
jgi:hypothetical protein